MSFTSEIKTQLASLESKRKSDKQAEFCGIFAVNDGILRTGSRDVALHAEKLCLRSGGVVGRAFFRNGTKAVYGLDMRWSGEFSINDRNSAAAFLRGCFIAGGYVSEPDSPAHIEITFRNVTSYELGMAAFELCNIVPKGTIKGSRFVLYLKDAEHVSAFLVTLGAIRGVLEYENARIVREGRRNSNRVINCDDANINKTLSAGSKQIEMINAVRGSIAYSNLPDGVKEIAELRLANPELSLTELGELCKPCVSKAGAAHRFAKIEKIYKDFTRKS
ncbi:MAG: DNA-binding protein WhiA [Clostridia bacterium]|nr:DNA-binding protein WhiA [Clostridia bacterium]